MAILCDTATVPVRDSADLWVEAVSELFVPLECVPHHGAAFHGRLRAGVIGPIAMCGLEVSPHTVKRTPRLAANTKGDQYKLSLILGGEALIVQDAREAVLRPGDFAIYDCSRPYTIRHQRSVPDARLRPAAGHHRAVARASFEDHGDADSQRQRDRMGDGAIPEAAGRLAVRDEAPPDEHRVVESVVDLVGSLCATVLTAMPARTRTLAPS